MFLLSRNRREGDRIKPVVPRTLSLEDIPFGINFVQGGQQSNPRPSGYKADALPFKLTRLALETDFKEKAKALTIRYGPFQPYLSGLPDSVCSSGIR
jgi:hypothetical protein